MCSAAAGGRWAGGHRIALQGAGGARCAADSAQRHGDWETHHGCQTAGCGIGSSRAGGQLAAQWAAAGRRGGSAHLFVVLDEGAGVEALAARLALEAELVVDLERGRG